MKQNITAHGHQNILSTYSTTIEITKESELTAAGDCIIAVGASAACSDLNIELRKRLMRIGPIWVFSSIKVSFRKS